jgi:acyl-CoA reductase-like NAD-dependent aldehyde dehydrogenase
MSYIFVYYLYIILPIFLRTQVEKYPNGNFVGPTVINNMTTEMDAYKQEIFGPVLCVINVDTLDDAIELINRQIIGIF